MKDYSGALKRNYAYLCCRIIFFNNMKNTNKIVTIVLNVLFCAALLYFFSRNSFLRPYAGSNRKEFFIGVMLLATLYINYFLLYPLLIKKRHMNVLYWLVVVLMSIAIGIIDMAIAYPNIMKCMGPAIEPIGFWRFFGTHTFILISRDVDFNFFPFMFGERKQLQDALDNEVKIVYQEVRKLDVVDHNNKLILIPIDDIYYCRQDGNYTRIYTVDNIWHTRLGSMIHLEQLFGKEDFVRISPTLLIPYKYIWSCRGGEIEMKKMPWTRTPLKFTIDTRNNDEIAEQIAIHLESGKTGHGRDVARNVPVGNEQHKRRDAINRVSTSDKKKSRPATPSKDKTDTVFTYIQSHPGCRSTEIATQTSISQSSVERCIAELRKQGRVEYEGSKKNGGYRAV